RDRQIDVAGRRFEFYIAANWRSDRSPDGATRGFSNHFAGHSLQLEIASTRFDFSVAHKIPDFDSASGSTSAENAITADDLYVTAACFNLDWTMTIFGFNKTTARVAFDRPL